MNRALLFVTFILLSFVVSAPEAEEQVENYFKPVAETGQNFTCNVDSSAEMDVTASVGWRSSPDTYDYSYFIEADYKHQTLRSSDEGKCLSAVRYYEKTKYNAIKGGKEVEEQPDVTNRKFFLRNPSALEYSPERANPLGAALIALDFGDPFSVFLPKKALRMKLEWEPDIKALDRLIYRMRRLQGEPPKTNDRNNNNKRDMENLGDVFEEAGGWGRGSRGPRNVDFNVTSCTARITEFKIGRFTAKAEFDGNITIPAGRDRKILIPFSGKMRFSYDTQYRALLNGSLQIDCNFDDQIEYRTYKVPVKVSLNQQLNISREYKPRFDEAKGINANAIVWNSGGEKAPLLIAGTKDGKLKLLANWDGTSTFEVLLDNKGIKGLENLPVAGSVSSDGRYMFVAQGKSLFLSKNFGESFKKESWRYDPIVRILFINSKTPLAIIKTETGIYYKMDCSSKRLSAKKLSPPALGKPILALCKGWKPDMLIFSQEKGYYRQVNGTRAKMIKNAPKIQATAMCRGDEGVYIIADALYHLKEEGYDEIEIEDIPGNIIKMVASGDDIYFLTSDNVLFYVPKSGGKVLEVSKEINGIAHRFKKVFHVGATGVTIH